jgi:SAM-dependent methyltransferase
MSALESFLAKPISYRLWQAPFAEAKFAPIRRHNDLTTVRKVLDVGCGPGTNTAHFEGVDYLGIDINERYVAYARSQFGRAFLAADATEFTAPDGESFDFILVNSFLHHIPDEAVSNLLAHLKSIVSDDGGIHVLELELPAQPSVAKLLARMDRGDHPRPLDRWRHLLAESFDPLVFERYPLTLPGPAKLTLWNMVYFKGRPHRA